MDLSVHNFKAISNFEYKNFKELTVLTGINSGGKSSFLHSLLMIKQSCISGNSSTPVILNGEYVSLGNFKDVYHQSDTTHQNIKSKITYNLSFHKSNDPQIIKKIEGSLFQNASSNFIFFSIVKKINDSKKFNNDINNNKKSIDLFEEATNLFEKAIFDQLESVSISYKFKVKNEKTIVSNLDINLKFSNSDDPMSLSLEEYRQCNRYILKTNSFVFFNEKDLLTLKGKKMLDTLDNLEFSDETPWLLNEEYEGKTYVNFNNLLPSIERFNKKKISSYFDLGLSEFANNLIIDNFNKFFESISYLGPLREAPQSLYLKRNDYNEYMGSKGENLINILVQNKETKIEIPLSKKGKLTNKKMSLIDGVNYWMCEKFEMAKSIEIKEHNDGKISQVLVNNSYDLQIPISSVGFGVSQILPIIVEGLLLKKNQTLLLEQPEIHLHPRLQSLLFDFLHSLTLQNRRVIVETHSDHFINRLRRRVAEESISVKKSLNNTIELFFVEEANMSSINVDKFGIIDKWPIGFFDQSNSENLALIKAQTFKRRNLMVISGENNV